MSAKKDFLFEIGTEELPPCALENLSSALASNATTRLTKAGLTFSKSESFATPRRLALLIRDLPTEQPQQTIERRGPAISAAFDQDGKPTAAALGFAKSCNISLEKAERLETDKGVFLYYKQILPGAKTIGLLPEIIAQTLNNLPIPKLMRWHNGEFAFIRPVHWVVMLFGEQVVPANIFGINAGNKTYGHRFHHPESIGLNNATNYAKILEQAGMVIADFGKRRQLIMSEITKAADPVGKVIADESLLSEVTGLIEWPTAVLCEFPKRFIELPKEAIVSPLQKHMRCFPVKKKDSEDLTPYFVAVSNIVSKNPSKVRSGYEKVINARLSDAQFFYYKDLSQPLTDYVEKLKTVIFQIKLGSVHDKVTRITNLAEKIAQEIGVDIELAKQSAYLAKADLMTDMVGEFPELQGIMGYYYAKHQNELDEVALAIKEQYSHPQHLTSVPLNIADRLDTLVGIFAINQPPTGDKDPFGLRRAALGILRCIISYQLPLNLETLIAAALASYNRQPGKDWNADTQILVMDFLFDRLYYEYLSQGNEPDVLKAILACKPAKPFDFDLRVAAVKEFKQLPEANALIAANKRVSNILEKGKIVTTPKFNPAYLVESLEKELNDQLTAKEIGFNKLYDQKNYAEALKCLAELKTPIDNFFDKIMVMVDDENVRNNRLALLSRIRVLFSQIADISLLQ